MGPRPGDYIDIHNHEGLSSHGVFIVENLMAHEDRLPYTAEGMVFSAGIHPWYLTESNKTDLAARVRSMASHESVVAIGEAGYDKLRGPATDLQNDAFGMQIAISEELSKPLFIHCVRSWDELQAAHKKAAPGMPWIVHGFRGSLELAGQLIRKNMYISFWFDFILRKESSPLAAGLPAERIFLETDGSGEDIAAIYAKVASDRNITVEDLKLQVFNNYNRVFRSI